MGNIKHVAIIFGISIGIMLLIGWWISRSEKPVEVLKDARETLEAPLSKEELQVAEPTITNTMNRTAVLKTNKGTISIELFEDKMPITTGNFIKLAQKGFYNGIKFHRVIDNFMIQAGDPNTKTDNVASYGTGGPGYTIQDEFVTDPLLSNVRGTIAMANTGEPNSGGSQFFINTVDNLVLNFGDDAMPRSNHPVFGRVIDGMDVVDAIQKVKTVDTRSNRPLEPVVIESVEITPGS